MLAAFLLVLMLALPGKACAGLASSKLGEIAVAPPPGARVPLASTWTDEGGSDVSLRQVLGGRPAVLIMADFTCTTLCGPILTITANALAQSRLQPARDYRIVVLGLDPKDSVDDARRMKQQQIADPAVASGTTLLRAGEAAVRGLTTAVGYKFTYDPEHDQFAHPGAVLVLSGDGRVTRVLSAFALNPNDLTLALVEAGRGQIGRISDQVRLLCYGFDPQAGVYTLSVYRALTIASMMSIIGLAVAILVMSRRLPRSRS